MTANDSLTLTSGSYGETQALGRRLGELAEPGDVFLLSGRLGAGKTCLTQGLAWGLGINDYTMSPSFVLVRELMGRLPLYHMDLYRLERLEEVSDLGLDEYFYSRGVSVVEWAERGEALLPEERLAVKIDVISENERRVTLTAKGERYLKLLSEIRDSLALDKNGTCN